MIVKLSRLAFLGLRNDNRRNTVKNSIGKWLVCESPKNNKYIYVIIDGKRFKIPSRRIAETINDERECMLRCPKCEALNEPGAEKCAYCEYDNLRNYHDNGIKKILDTIIVEM